LLRLLFALALVVAAGPAQARVMPLDKLPDEKLLTLTPLLQHGDVALIESNRDGTMKQVTLILFVAAPPRTVHEVLAHPGDYKKFVPNVSKSTWEARPDGGVSTWKLDLPVSSFEQTNVYHFDPGEAGGVDLTCPNPEDDATYRWELLPATGGTLLVQYGYTDVKHSNALVRRFLKKMPVTEHGLALAAQLLLAANMKREAERRTPPGSLEPVDGKAKPGGFGFLLDRGQVVVMRSTSDGRFADASLLDRMYAPSSAIAALLARPGAWSSFVPGVEGSSERSRLGDMVSFHSDFAIPLVTWSSTWEMRLGERAFDAAAVDGDLRGARFRWDLTPRAPSETLVVYRVTQRLTQSSSIFRKLVDYEPSLEHGLNVAFSLVYLRAMRARAEGWK
jgi:hypothetical protein